MNSKFYFSYVTGIIMVCSIIPLFTQAQIRTAINNGIWNDVANWDCNCVPGPTNDVIIGDALIISVSGDVTIKSVTVNNLAVFTVHDTLRVTEDVTIEGIFNDSGLVYIMGDITNNGVLYGPGTYCIGGVSTNTQSMFGPMDFCDLTPPSTSPYIDNISGSSNIQPNVTFCANGICAIIGVKKSEAMSNKIVVAYAQGIINVELTDFANRKMNLELLDIQGRVLLNQRLINGNNQVYPPKKFIGLFLYRISDSENILDQGKLLLK